MKHTPLLLTACLAGFAFTTPVLADPAPAATPPAVASSVNSDFIPKDQWDKMTPAQKAAVRAKRKADWDKLTPEQKEAKRMQMRKHYESLPADQQAKIRQQMQARRDRQAAAQKAGGTTTAPATSAPAAPASPAPAQ